MYFVCKQGKPHPHLVAFTPRGDLLSHNHSQPNEIKMWPKVESLWSSSEDIKSEKSVPIKDVNYIHRYNFIIVPQKMLPLVVPHKRP